METLALITGYIVLTGLALFTLALIFEFRIDSDQHLGKFSIIKFGMVWTGDEELIVELKELRKDDNAGLQLGKRCFFITCPAWFNQHVRNLGGVK